MSAKLAIWIVDDDPIQIFIYEKLLHRIDASDGLSSFANGLQAIEKINSCREGLIPDIIFLDINMPGMNGWQFLDAYSKLSAEITNRVSIYIASSSPLECDKINAAKYSCVTGFIVKPVGQQALTDILQAVKKSISKN